MEPGANTHPSWKNPDLRARHHILFRPQQPQALVGMLSARAAWTMRM